MYIPNDKMSPKISVLIRKNFHELIRLFKSIGIEHTKSLRHPHNYTEIVWTRGALPHSLPHVNTMYSLFENKRAIFTKF
jgi:hypothetical protein